MVVAGNNGGRRQMVAMFSTIAVRGVSRGMSAGTKLVWVGEGGGSGMGAGRDKIGIIGRRGVEWVESKESSKGQANHTARHIWNSGTCFAIEAT